MLRVPLHKIRPGMVLARPIPLPNDPRRYWLQRDQEIPLSLLPRLRELGVVEVWVRCRSLEFLEELIDPELGERQREVYAQVRKNFEMLSGDSAAEMDFGQFQNSITGLFDCLKRSSTGNILLQKLDAFDNVLLSHSTNVCYLALLLGLRVRRYLIDERPNKSAREAMDLTELGLGCLLHDVGKMRIPLEILNKPGRLTFDEMETMKQHPALGFEMVKGHVPPAAASVVLNHHQRYAGGGYPGRTEFGTGAALPPLAGKQIPVFSRIATLCDVYDAATTHRVYAPAKPPVQALHEMRTMCRGMFDPVIEAAFYEIIPPFPIGQAVTLSDGTQAAVVDFNPRSPVRPKVQPLRRASGEAVPNPALEELDLAIYDDLEIVAVDDRDVRSYTASLQPRELSLI